MIDQVDEARRRTFFVVSAALLLLHVGLAWMMRVPGMLASDDGASYLALAAALRQFSYAELWTVGHPMHAMYPPGFPALLALLGASGPSDVTRALVGNIAASALGLALATVLVRRAAPHLALPMLLICAPNPQLLFLSGRVLSEPLFMALIMTALLVLAAGRRDGKAAAMAIVAAVAAALTRSIGVALIAVVLLEFVLSRRWRSAALSAIVAVATAGAWLGWTVIAPRQSAGSSYIADAVYAPPVTDAPPPTSSGSDAANPVDRVAPAVVPESAPSLPGLVVRRIRTNLPVYLAQSSASAFSLPMIPRSYVDNAAWLALLLPATVIGFTLLVRSPQRATALFLAAYGSVLLVWPYVMDRFLAPVLPLLALLVLLGVERLAAHWTSDRTARAATWALAAVIASSALWSDAKRLGAIAGCERHAASLRSAACVSQPQRDFFSGVALADRLTPADEPILTAREPAVYLLSGRLSVRQSDAMARRDPDSLVAFLRRSGVRTVLLSRLYFAEWGLAPALEARCRKYDVLARAGARTVILRLRKETAAPAVDGSACRAIAAWAAGDWVREVHDPKIEAW